MFHGCLMRGIPITIFCIVFIACVVILLCSTIITAIKNKNKQGFKEIIKEAFSDLLDEGLDIGIYILAGCFILMVIIVPISYSKKHALNEAQFYYERCVTLSEEINRSDENKESLSKELKSYDIALVNKKWKNTKKQREDLITGMKEQINKFIKKAKESV